MTKRPKVPRKIPAGLYAAEHDGTGDPDRIIPAERALHPVMPVEQSRRESPSPATRALQRATDKALGRRAR